MKWLNLNNTPTKDVTVEFIYARSNVRFAAIVVDNICRRLQFDVKWALIGANVPRR